MKQRKSKQSGEELLQSEAPYLDENAIYLHGWPGFRTHPGKSGLDYFDSNTELGHMQGLFIRWLFTGKFRTHNPIYLLFMIFIGLFIGLLPLGMIFWELFIKQSFAMLLLLVISFPNIAGGVALLINVVLSVADWNGETITGAAMKNTHSVKEHRQGQAGAEQEQARNKLLNNGVRMAS